jgi:hypothetical protein
MLSRLSAFWGSLQQSHLLGLLVALFAMIGTTDIAAAAACIPGRLGFRWQATLVGATPISCAAVCLVMFLLAPVGNCSQHALIRGIGAISVLGRYCVFAVVVSVAVSVGVLFLNIITSSRIESLRLVGDLSPLSKTWGRINDDVGQGVVFRWAGYETQVFFLREKRAAVLHALEKEHIRVEKSGYPDHSSLRGRGTIHQSSNLRS